MSTNAQSYTLTITKSGTGGGTVTSDVGGISCGATCSILISAGTTVVLTETPDATSSFSGWSGAASGTNPNATITMDNNKTVSANFTRKNYALNVVTDGTGSGNVSSSPSGISCPVTCSANYMAGTVVSLTATPNTGSVFTSWSGECSGTGACNVSITSVTSVTATFTYVSNNYYPDNDGDGYGAGTVIVAGVQPPNTSINNTDCDDTNPSVHPGAAEICGNGIDDDCNGLVDDCIQFTLTLSKSGSGGGTVTSNVGGINCGSTCTYSYPPGTVVTITETPDATSHFGGWSGAASGTNPNATITVDGNKTVGSNFTRNNYALNVVTDGAGSGNISSSPSGISCPATCSANYMAGTMVNLTATPGTGSVFTGWSGGCSGTGACSFTMESTANVSASFCLLPGNAGVISGNNHVCSGTTQIYSIVPVANATGYSWTLPSGWTGSSTTNSITAEAGISGTISVTARNSCGSGIAQVLNVTVDPMPQDLDVKNGLVAFYPFNGNANDESVNSNNGTVNGPVPVNDRNSKPAGAYYFDGLNDYILVKDPVPASLQIQNEITLSAWIYVLQYPGTSNLGLIVGSQCDGCGSSGASIFLDGRTNSDGQPSPAGHIHFQIGNGSWHQANSNSQVPLNQWVLITATRKAYEDAKIYYNDVLQPSTSLPWTGSVSYAGTWFAMGSQKDYGDRFFKGTMDEVRVYNRALSDLEIKTLYQDKEIYATRDTLCHNESTSIHLVHSENGISYQLLKDGNDAGISQAGNGNELIFNTGSLASSSQFTVKATNSNGNCNMILDTILAITVNPAYAFTENDTVCKGVPYPWHGSEYTEAGTYVAAYSTINGCDSIYTLHLAVTPVYAFTEDYSICEGDKYTWHGTDYSVAGTYVASYSTRSGCDSIFTLNLKVNPAYAFAEDYSICEGETFTWHGGFFKVAGTYLDSLKTVTGCDSIYSLNLTVNPVYAFTENHSICKGETYNWHGRDYTETGAFLDIHRTVKGCDSTYMLNLAVKTVDASVTRNGSVITANAINAAYQWLDGSRNFLPLAGETSQNFTANSGGIYAVEVTQDECSDTSESIEIIPTLIVTPETEGIYIYPNPVISELIIENRGSLEKKDFKILNSSGQIIFTGNLCGKTIVNTSGFLPGIYMIKLENGISFEIKKIIKE